MNSTTRTTTPTAHRPISELSDLFLQATDLAADVMDSIRPEQYEDRALGMTVGELAEHIVMAVRRTACVARALPFTEWPMDAADVKPGQWADAVKDAAADVVVAFQEVAPDRVTHLPWGVFPADNVLAVYINEVTVHTWDLAQATGQSPTWDDEVVDASSIAIHEQLPDADRRPMWDAFAATLPEGIPWEDPFANAVPVPVDAPAIDRLVAWNGRQP